MSLEGTEESRDMPSKVLVVLDIDLPHSTEFGTAPFSEHSEVGFTNG